MNYEYSDEIARKILDKFHEKGWSLYEAGSSVRKTKKDITCSLKINTWYLLLPVADTPKNIEELINALESFPKKLGEKKPTIKIDSEKYLLKGITLEPYGVMLHTPEDKIISYPEFIKALDSFINVND